LASDVATELQKLGGARVIAATATNADAITAAVGGLGLHGELLTLAAWSTRCRSARRG
jgi:alcohol dehydrogenase